MNSPTLAPVSSATSPRRRFCWWLRQAERGFAVIGIVLIVLHFTVMQSVIVSPSMSPTLQGQSWSDGDRVLTELVSYRFRTPRRWEVVAYRRADGAVVMKRVVGLPGETVQMHNNGELVVNGQPVARPPSLTRLRYIPIGKLFNDRIAECRRSYFVLGDDSKDSEDSRYEEPILVDSILGRAWLIVGPWSRTGWVHRD